MHAIDDVESKVIESLAGIYNVPREQITPASRIIADLGADSISIIETIILIEHNWPGIEVPDDESFYFSTVADIISLVKTKLREQNLHVVN